MGSTSSSSSGMGGSGGGNLPDVSGTRITTYIFEGGETTVPEDPSTHTLSALVLDQSNVFSAPIPGTADATGKFTIPGVPDGTYYLVDELNPSGFKTVLVTSKRTIDLGGHRPGRPDAKRTMVPATNVELTVDGLNPFQTSDDLEMYTLGSLTYVWNFQMYTVPPPMAGATSLVAAKMDVSQFLYPGLIDGGKGDLTYISQLVGQVDGGNEYRTLKKLLAPAPFTITEGATTPVNGTMQDVPQKPLNLSWSRGAFVNLAAQVHPDAQPSTEYVSLGAEPGGPSRQTANIPALAFVSKNDGSATVNLSMQYGNPYPAGWAETIMAYTGFSQPFTVPGDPKAHKQSGLVVVETPLMGQSNISLTPKVSPPTNITVNGMPLTAAQSGVGTSPKIEWQAPSMGAPTLYRVNLFEVDPALTSPKIVGTIVTTNTSFSFPPGMLKAGSWYTMRVTAEEGASDAAINRFVRAPRAAAVTSPFTP